MKLVGAAPVFRLLFLFLFLGDVFLYLRVKHKTVAISKLLLSIFIINENLFFKDSW